MRSSAQDRFQQQKAAPCAAGKDRETLAAQHIPQTGNVTSDEVSGLPLDEDDKATVKDFEKELEDAANSASGSQNNDWTLESVQKGAEIGGFIAVGNAESTTDEIKDDNGNVLSTTTTVTARFEKEVDTEAPAPLQKSELEQILNTTLTENEDGTVAKVVVGDMTYEFGYTVKSTAGDVKNLTNAEIIKLLPKDQGYKLVDGKIFKTIDGATNVQVTSQTSSDDKTVYVVTYEKDGATFQEEYTLTISDEIDPSDLPEELGKIV